MKQKIFIILGLVILIIVLIGLNAVSYTQKDTELDSELRPNRSTYNAGATGTRAFLICSMKRAEKPSAGRTRPPSF